jgi:uncharacterized protein YegL
MTIMKVELSIHASGLKNIAGALKGTSDPFAVVTKIATATGSKPEILGKTEIIKNSLSPMWVKVFILDYELGTPTKVAINVFDEVRKGENKAMGAAVFDIGELLGARGNTKAKKIQKGGTLFAHVRKSQGSGLLRLKMKGTKLKNVEGMFGKSDPFFELSRKQDSAGGLTWDNIFRSNVVKNNLNPEWDNSIIELATLCDADLDRPILVSVFDFESSGKHVPMGTFETSVNALQKAEQTREAFKLKHKGKEVGTITVVNASVDGVEEVSEQMARVAVSPSPSPSPTAAAPYTSVGQPNFVDYVSGGLDLNVTVAIDFTGSNGDPRKPGTLHHLGSTKNDYEKAISAIVGILSHYDSDQMFPVFGFGAKYDGTVRHCFQCGGQEEVHGVAGVLEAYHQVFKSGLIMSGPTVFTEVIETAAARANSAQFAAGRNGLQAYTILLILTDGAVSDAQATAAALNKVSDAPLSVVIVGVGDADFSSMQFLDDSSKPGKRDIAQFVEFNKHSRDSVALTSETLGEIPDQLVGYFQSKSIAPLPPLQRSDSSIMVEPEEDEIDLTLDIGEDEIVVTGGGEGFVDGFGR